METQHKDLKRILINRLRDQLNCSVINPKALQRVPDLWGEIALQFHRLTIIDLSYILKFCSDNFIPFELRGYYEVKNYEGIKLGDPPKVTFSTGLILVIK